MNIDISEWKNLDPASIGSWPLLPRMLVILAICVGVLVLGYQFDTKEQLANLESIEEIEGKLKEDYKTKQSKAANLAAYKQQMKEMEESFGTMLRQLPSKTEVADLLVDITQTGLAAGLEFERFEPTFEIARDFYAELPIKIKIAGGYHSFGEFVGGVAALPRIVTLHDISITKSGKGVGGSLVLEAVAKTYRYLDEEEIAANARKKAAKKGRGR